MSPLESDPEVAGVECDLLIERIDFANHGRGVHPEGRVPEGQRRKDASARALYQDRNDAVVLGAPEEASVRVPEGRPEHHKAREETDIEADVRD